MLSEAKRVISYAITRFKLPTVLVALIVFWVPVIIFAQLADEVIEKEPIEGDIAILNFIHGFASPMLDAIFLVITNLGGAIAMIIISACIIGYFLYKKHWQSAAVILFGVGGAAGANLILKLLFQRDRPSLWTSMVVEHSYSFPSGHAMASSAFAVTMIVLSWRTRYRWWVVAAAGLFTLLVGVSRMYFGVHYPTDILAGWCVGSAWVIISTSLISNFPFQLRTYFARLLKKVNTRNIKNNPDILS